MFCAGGGAAIFGATNSKRTGKGLELEGPRLIQLGGA